VLAESTPALHYRERKISGQARLPGCPETRIKNGSIVYYWYMCHMRGVSLQERRPYKVKFPWSLSLTTYPSHTSIMLLFIPSCVIVYKMKIGSRNREVMEIQLRC
jgi:hypothetical protein